MSDSKQEIMESTFEALCRHGYADLTIEKIADESEKGKSNIYYHFDDKQALILEFLDFMQDQLEQEFTSLNTGSPEKKFDAMLEMMLGVENQEMWDFHRALMEIQARTQYSEELREKFAEIDELVEARFTELLWEMQVEDPEMMAELLVSVIQGSLSRKISANDRQGLKQIKTKIKEITDPFNCDNTP